jgi:hypothetical protein
MPQARGTSMYRPCRVRGCNRRVRGYGHWCDKHYHHRCRHGHEEQIPITRTWLRPFQLRAVRFLDDHGEEAWIAMRKAWRQLVDNVRADLAAQERRGVCYRHERTAWKEIIAVDDTVNEDEVMTMLLAFGIVFHEDGRAFRDHASFKAQVARRFRAMSPATKKAYRYPSGETKLVCRDISMRAVQSIGTRLVEGYALFGVHIAVELERRAKAADKIKDDAMAVIKSRSLQDMEATP